MYKLEDLESIQKMERIIDNIFLTMPLFSRTLFRNREGYHRNPLSSEFRVLGILMRNEDMPISRIGSWMRVSKPNMTTVIDKLISEEKVKRKQDPTDRRIVKISLTKTGREYMRKCRNEMHEAVKKELSSLSSEEIDSLLNSLETIRHILSKINEVESK